MKVVFYDRENKREVSSEQLMRTRVVRDIAVGDSNDMIPTGRKLRPDTYEPLTYEVFLKEKEDEGFNLENSHQFLDKEWEQWKSEYTPRVLYLREDLLSDLAYKSENCPEYCNWDLHTNTSSLVFLRLEV
jgi:hypothetical protein